MLSNTKIPIKKIIWFLGLALFLTLFIRYQIQKDVISFYNRGNRYYRLGRYDLAVSNYKEALVYKPTHNQDCKIRINLALAMVAPITPESVTYENLADSIAILEDARDMLCANDCAHRNDNDGHNETAQTLKNEIDEYIKWLKENVKPPESNSGGGGQGGGGGSSNNNQQQDEDDGMDPEERDLRNQFEEIQQQGMEERNEELPTYGEYFGDYEYYGGKCW